ncbi:response regulator [Yersinia sp. 2540 StPb PI]
MLDMTVLVVDEHPIIRSVIKRIIECKGGEVLESNCRTESVRIAHMHKPDLIILDILTNEYSGLGLIEQILRVSPDSKIIIFTAMVFNDYAIKCMDCGVYGYVSKTDSIDNLESAIKAVMSGYCYFPKLIISFKNDDNDEQRNEYLIIKSLSPNEIAVMQGISQGLTINDIANNINVSRKTISAYKRKLHEKFNAKSIIQLSIIAKRHGLRQ